ncbi:hypothetical protein OGM63_24800 [Plectonema radiosum NIES-515]|uniref:Uncharacterized protein n=1 Tax=Plectonema radiosum NIES-515 TaxID=2986073 RepID=A0ABT3B5M2_9CYAN|nr:hypothetical protein [Plectonema radiosum]MCV3216683.1 hypothetical protein [Plectonema radiosum NIES-515]
MSNYSSEIDAIDSTVMPKFWEAVVQFLRQANIPVSFFVDTNYVGAASRREEVDDDYNYSDRSHNNRWHNRAYRAGRYARNAYDCGQNYSRGITPAMENGASAAIATLGTVANHTNPFRPWRWRSLSKRIVCVLEHGYWNFSSWRMGGSIFPGWSDCHSQSPTITPERTNRSQIWSWCCECW